MGAGDLLGRCGNSSEPHLHLQCMDHENVLLADGVPLALDDLETRVPSSTQPFVARPAGGDAQVGR